ncbi:MAG: triphosphoribosyl-dephospho-CoA synthase [Caldiserica bacterium]|jgi:triphosphoribosyl-dephospho-CoA synthase|nr:triphosphoribosyl-dephospho-CoA synthase [Caldisericota bacterium]MDH7562019.1 triphosphoribosyl-dephospho-CoA synthase [Caldisericota bacterium]
MGSGRFTPFEVAQMAQISCILEATAEKPGNVTRFKDASDMRYTHFLLSAIAIGPAFEKAKDLGVGEIIFSAIRDTHRFVHCNTNLGIVLLLAPLAKACLEGGEWETSLNRLLNSLTVEDAIFAYRAIRIANPGGMGKVKEYDVQEGDPDITLKEAMELARERDLIAREYVSDFEITLSFGAPELLKNWEKSGDILDSIVQTFLLLLSEFPDSKISRSRGEEIAREVSSRASEVLKEGGIYTRKGRDSLFNFDLFLREGKLNPGTTADLVTSSLFVVLIEKGPEDFLKKL